MPYKKIIIASLVCSFMAFGFVSKVSHDKSNISPVYAADEYITLWEGRSDNVIITSDKLPSTNPKSFRIDFVFGGGDDVNISTLNDYVVFNIPVFEKQFEINFPANDWARILSDGGLKFSTGTFSGNEFEKISCTKDSPVVGDKFTVDGINYVITAVGDTNTVKVGDNTKFTGTTVNIPANVTDNGVTFDVTEIGANAFTYNKTINEIEIPESVTIIGRGAFSNCTSITEIEIPAGVTTIEKDVFRGCSRLASVKFAENSALTTIGEYAFYQVGITEIEIPASVISIEGWAFYNCAELTAVKVLATAVPTTGENIFGACANLTTIYVPASSLEAYQTAWADYADKIKALHTHAIKETHPAVEPTCLVAGHKVYYECECGKYFSDEALTQEITNLEAWKAEDGDGYVAPKGHSFGGEVTYTWTDDPHYQCTASRKCQRDGCNETQTEIVVGVYVKDFDATCTANEKGHYEATFTIEEFEKQVTPMFDVPNTAKGHEYTKTYTWNDDHTKCTATATCSHGDSTITNEGTVTIEDGYAVATFEDPIFETQRFKLPDPTPSKDGLSGGAIAGIAAGSVVGVCLIAYVAMFFVWKKNEKALKFLKPSFAWINKKIFRK